MQPEANVLGASVVLHESIVATIQENFAPNEYGIPTIGSYDIHYYDIQSYDGAVEED